MPDPTFPDHHHLLAADGWLDLGLPGEALRELDRLPEAIRRSLIAANLSWRAHATRHDWTQAWAVADQMVADHPDDASGWLHRSYTLHELRRTREATEALLPAVAKFPTHPVVPYNLACYACQLGDADAARRWLAEVVRLKGVAYLRDLAMDDPDLAVLRDEIATWGGS